MRRPGAGRELAGERRGVRPANAPAIEMTPFVMGARLTGTDTATPRVMKAMKSAHGTVPAAH